MASAKAVVKGNEQDRSNLREWGLTNSHTDGWAVKGIGNVPEQRHDRGRRERRQGRFAWNRLPCEVFTRSIVALYLVA